MLKKYNNILLFIILLILVCFFLFNNSLIETLEKDQDKDTDKDKDMDPECDPKTPLKITQSGENSSVVNAYNHLNSTSKSNQIAMKCANFSQEDSIKALEAK